MKSNEKKANPDVSLRKNETVLLEVDWLDAIDDDDLLELFRGIS